MIDALPGVWIHYAVKCNPDLEILRELNTMGCCFDLATEGEVKLMQDVGVPAEWCINTNPVKTPANIRANIEFGIEIFVFDNESELPKFLPFKE